MKKLPLILFHLTIFIIGCTGSESRVEDNDTVRVDTPATMDTPVPAVPDTSIIPVGDNSRTSLDWEGTYLGMMPCADCEGIATTITLYKNMSYTMFTRYIGKKGSPVQEYRGRFSWNESGGNITLEGVPAGANQYQVGENKLTKLDMKGRRITGGLAGNYVLAKQAH